MEYASRYQKGEIMIAIVEYFCITHDAGPWTKYAIGSNNKPILQIHKNLGCKIVEYKDKPKLRGKENWGNTSIENEFTNHMLKNYDKMLHSIISSCKGPKKSQLIRGIL